MNLLLSILILMFMLKVIIATALSGAGRRIKAIVAFSISGVIYGI
jgi:hypothetical protein